MYEISIFTRIKKENKYIYIGIYANEWFERVASLW